MKAARLWSIRNAGWLKKCYAALEDTLALFNPLLEDRIGEIVTRSNALGGREPWRRAL